MVGARPSGPSSATERRVVVPTTRPGRRRLGRLLLRRPPTASPTGSDATAADAYDRVGEPGVDGAAQGGAEADVTTDQAVVAALRMQRIELPSWAFGNSGTRFKVFAQKGVPRDPYEKIADAAQVHRYTGVAPTVALHIPWDAVDSYASLAAAAADAGIGLRTDRQ